MSARQLARLRALVEEKRRKEEEAKQLAKEEEEEEEEEEEYRPSVSFSVKYDVLLSVLGTYLF